VNARLLTQLQIFGLAYTSSIDGYAAEGDKLPNNTSTFSVFFENDLFGDAEQQFTNGVQLSWESPDLTRYADADRLPKRTLPIVTRLPWINEPNTQRNLGFSIGQRIFTPNNTQRSNLVANDRPYAGWLYGRLSFTNKTANRMDRIEFQLGVIGPAAQGDQAQNFVI